MTDHLTQAERAYFARFTQTTPRDKLDAIAHWCTLIAAFTLWGVIIAALWIITP